MTSVARPPKPAAELTAVQVAGCDAGVRPMLRKLGDVYSTLRQALGFDRAGDPTGKGAHAKLARHRDEEFTTRQGGGTALLLERG
ncbi:hypothetical protein [Streptomyces sp. NPDC054794]